MYFIRKYKLFFAIKKQYNNTSDGKAQVLQNNLPLKYDPLLYWTTQQRSSYSLTSNNNNSKLLLTSFVSHKNF